MTLSPSTSGLLASLSDDLAAAVEHVGRSVVAVHGRRRFPASGLAWAPDQVLTAAHVLERDTDLSISTPDGVQHAATIVGGDRASDIALLRVEAAALTPVERAESAIGAGHLVLAVGRPGTPSPTASFGVVSSSGGAWRTAQGGVMLPARGRRSCRAVRRRTRRCARSGGRHAQLASPAATRGIPPHARHLVQRVLKGGSLKRAYLGVSTQPVELQGPAPALSLAQGSGLMLL
jgi:S1-C subfamily serine protease